MLTFQPAALIKPEPLHHNEETMKHRSETRSRSSQDADTGNCFVVFSMRDKHPMEQQRS